MSNYVLKNCKLYTGGYNLSGDLNEMELQVLAQIMDNTTFGEVARRRIAGLTDIEANMRGFWTLGGASESVPWNNLGVADEIVTVCPTTGAAGEIAYCFKGIEAEYSCFGQVGVVAPFAFTARGSGSALFRGTVLENGAKTATGVGTARQIGQVSATQKLYAALHVIAVSGTSPTIDVVLQSDSLQAFSSPTDRIAFTQVNAVGAQWATPVSGAITDDWWRLSWTVGGSGVDLSFTIVGIIGIQ